MADSAAVSSSAPHETATHCAMPGWLLCQMLVNNAVSDGIVFVPIVRDVAFAIWKADSRNAVLHQ